MIGVEQGFEESLRAKAVLASKPGAFRPRKTQTTTRPAAGANLAEKKRGECQLVWGHCRADVRQKKWVRALSMLSSEKGEQIIYI